MKKILQISLMFLIMQTPLLGMKQQISTPPTQECTCGIKFQAHRFRFHIYAHHTTFEHGKKKYVCPNENCDFTPFTKTTEVINHLVLHHHLVLQQHIVQQTQIKKSVEQTNTSDLWNIPNENEKVENKTLCTCGRKWPKEKKAQINHIKTYHHQTANFQKTYYCSQADCCFTANSPELVVKHNNEHDSTIKPVKKIKKKRLKQPRQEKVYPILPNITQPVNSSTTQAISFTEGYQDWENLNFQTEPLEELFPITFD